MKFDFKGQTVLIAGGTRGIGRAISEAFLNAGAKVIATYRNNDAEAKKFKESNFAYAECLDIHKFDVANYEGVEKFYREVESKHDNFQVVVISSGIRSDSIVGMMKTDVWNDVIDTNLTGTFNLCKLAVQYMMRQKYGRIIVLTSPVGKLGLAGQANYAASKAGQVAFMKSLSKEVASRKITVNCVSPGFIETSFIADLPDEQRDAYKKQVPLKRFGTPEDVTYPVLFLASKESSYITGSVLEVTGGL
jgi:3-oxoacyl-[acyl-carrier protein] reductase